MNLLSIVMLLQVALGLLSNPNLQSNPELKQQATLFANQAIVIAGSALKELSTTSSTSQLSSPTSTPIPESPQSLSQPQTNYSPTSTPMSEPTPSPTSPLTLASQAKLEVAFNGNSITATGWTAKTVKVSVYGNNGEVKKVGSEVQVVVTATDASQNVTLNGTGNYLTNGDTFYYYPKTSGIHNITLSVPAYGISKTVSFEATPYNRVLPTMRLDWGSPLSPSVTLHNSDPSNLAIVRIDSPDMNDQYYVRDVFYEVTSDTLTDQDIGLGLYDTGGNQLNPSKPFSGAIPLASSKTLVIKGINAEKTGKFRLSISARFFSVGEDGKELTLSNLPLITSEIEIK